LYTPILALVKSGGTWIVVQVKRGNMDFGYDEEWRNVDRGSGEECENVDFDVGLTVTAKGTFSCSSDRYF
jgi:hypothetical protein